MAKQSLLFSVFLLLIFVFAISGVEAIILGSIPKMAIASKPPPKICEKGSKMYSGNCYSKLCDKKCKEWEKALHGACHQRESKNTCFCYYDCEKTSPPPKEGSPPPADGGSPPPPADGGSPPPPAAGGSPPPPAW